MDSGDSEIILRISSLSISIESIESQGKRFVKGKIIKKGDGVAGQGEWYLMSFDDYQISFDV